MDWTPHVRRAFVAILRAEGKTKAEIARQFNVSWETINRDCKNIETQSQHTAIASAVDAILYIARKHFEDDLSTVEAHMEIEKLIESVSHW